jgi:hypothetical protein
MQGSKSLLKRKREVDAEEKVVRDARQLRREMRMRGHVVRDHYETNVLYEITAFG